MEKRFTTLLIHSICSLDFSLTNINLSPPTSSFRGDCFFPLSVTRISAKDMIFHHLCNINNFNLLVTDNENDALFFLFCYCFD